MIVVDTDVIAAFWIRTARTPTAVRVRRQDPAWAAPILWRSEFRSVLRQYLAAGHVGYADALWIANKVERSMRSNEYAVDTADVLKLVDRTGHSSYDCEFVALAQALGVPLVTGDVRLMHLFPGTAVKMDDFVG